MPRQYRLVPIVIFVVLLCVAVAKTVIDVAYYTTNAVTLTYITTTLVTNSLVTAGIGVVVFLLFVGLYRPLKWCIQELSDWP